MRTPKFLAPYKQWALKTLMPLKTVEIDGLKFRYLRNDSPPQDPKEFLSGIEFHEMIKDLTGQSAIDIGANIGSYTLPLARKFENVSAFEPSPAHTKVLRLNIKLNNLTNVHVYEVALSDSNGTMQLYLRKGGAASLDPKHYALAYDNATLVKTARLDEYSARFQRLDFMKVDAEGLELRILNGGSRMISSLTPIIAIEVHRARVPSGGSCRCEVCDRLRTFSYEVRVTGESSSVGHVHWVWASPRKRSSTSLLTS